MKRLLLCLLPALFVLCAPAFGQLPSATSPNSQPAPAEIEPAPTDPLNRETPASSMRAFLEAAERFDWPLAANYLDLRNLPSEVSRMGGEELAEQFYFILSRRQVNISEDSVSDKPGGQIDLCGRCGGWFCASHHPGRGQQCSGEHFSGWPQGGCGEWQGKRVSYSYLGSILPQQDL